MESQGDGWRLSLLAGAAGIGVCVGLLLVSYYVLPLPQWAYFLAIFLAISSGGVVIGLIDRRRPFVTVLAATALAAITHLVYPLGVSDLTEPTELLASVVTALLFAALIALLAAAGVAAVARKAHWRLAWVRWSIFALLLVGVFILPWARLQHRGRMFMMSRESDVRAFLEDRIMALPKTELSWRPGPSRDWVWGSFGAEFTTTWEVATQTAGPGRCALRFEVRSLKRDRPVEDVFNRARLFFKPNSPTGLQNSEQALSLLQELGLKLQPDSLRPTAGGGWQGRNPMWELYPVRTASGEWLASIEFSIRRSGQVACDVLRYWDT